jgi:hypothetical protein
VKEHTEHNQKSAVVALVAETAREQIQPMESLEQKMTDLQRQHAHDFSTSCLAATANSTAVHVRARATSYLGDHFDFLDGGSWLNERGEAQSQYGQREVALLTRVEEVASYISECPMFAEGICSMEENDWLEVSRAARRLMLRHQRTQQGQMVMG